MIKELTETIVANISRLETRLYNEGIIKVLEIVNDLNRNMARLLKTLKKILILSKIFMRTLLQRNVHLHHCYFLVRVRRLKRNVQTVLQTITL